MDAAYFAALAADEDLGRTRGIDATLAKFNLDAILLPTDGKESAICHISLLMVSIRFYLGTCCDRRISYCYG